MDYLNIKELVCQLAKRVGEFQVNELKSFDRTKIIAKGFNDPVSYVDQESEKMLVAGLTKILPDAGFLTEEETLVTDTSGLHWVIDPLDGTNNFVHQVPFFGISIALCDGHDILLGVVHEPNSDQCFSATKGGGAFLNNDPITVSQNDQLAKALVATGFPYSLLDKEESYFNIIRYVINNSHGLRRLGAASLDLCYVACGRFDAYFEFNLQPWDITAGTLIVREAGGIVSKFDSQNFDVYDGKQIVATCGFQEELTELINQHWI